MQINPERLQALALLNPGPIERAIDSYAAQPVVQDAGASSQYSDVFGSPAQASPMMPPAVAPTAADLAGGAPAGAPKAPSMGPNPQQMQQLFAMMQGPQQKQQFAPGAPIAPAPQLKFPSMPNLSPLMGGRGR